MKRFLSIALVLLSVSIAFAGPQGTSSTTGTNMIARARVYLDEPSSDIRQWTEAELLQFLNDGMVDIVARTKCYQGTEAITLVANTVEYTPTTDYIDVVAAVCNPASGSSWGLKHGNIRSRASSATTDLDGPEFFYEFGGKVGFYPAYSSVTTETVTVYFAKYPTAIAAGGTVPLSKVFDNALVYYITAQAFLLDKRITEANNYLNLYFSELSQYRQEFVEADNETLDPIH